MYLIDKAYFVRDLAVPNIQPSLDIPNNEVSFDWYIDRYARQLLQNALGNFLFDELDSQITDGALNSNADQKWKDLVNGKSYTKDNYDLKWKGLIYEEGAFKGSVLAYYTYYHWHLEQMSRMSAMGEVKGKAVNTTAVNSTATSVKIWNKYIMMYQGICNERKPSFSIVRGVPFTDYYYQRDSDYVSLLGFLADHEEDYPNALKLIEREGINNTFGL